MNDLQIFENEKFGKIRAIEIENAPYFVAKDVCEILEIKNSRQALTRLDDDEKADVILNDGSQNRNMSIVNEYGLYSLVLSSRKSEAKEFKRWITHEVIPSIRKTGGYIAGEENMSEEELVLKAMEVMTRKVKALEEKTAKLETENSAQFQLIGELKPKADYTDRILQNKGLVTITAIAKDYGMSGEKMNEKLHELGVQYKQSGQWLLYREYHNNGYTHSETIDLTHKDGSRFVRMNTKWTQKGRLFLYDILKKNGIIPSIEKEA